MRKWAGRDRLEILPFDGPGVMDLHIDLSYERCLRSVQLVRDGRLSEGPEAAARALGLRPGFGWIPWIQGLPLVRNLSRLVYRLIANRRQRCESCT